MDLLGFVQVTRRFGKNLIETAGNRIRAIIPTEERMRQLLGEMVMRLEAAELFVGFLELVEHFVIYLNNSRL